MKLAKELEAADEYIELDRENPQSQWDKLKQDYPHGFDVVVSTSSLPFPIKPISSNLTIHLKSRSIPPMIRFL